MSVDYVNSFVDPFNQTISQPKIFDGSVPRSSGLRFRNTGNFSLDPAGGVNYVVLLPGFSNMLCWKRTTDLAYATTSLNSSHVADDSDRANIHSIRLHSGAVRFGLLNSSDENEGYWEAVRIPITKDDILFAGGTWQLLPRDDYTLADMANHHTYQTGRLRDLGRYQFKLNSISPDHPFTEVKVADAGATLDHCLDETFDMVVIKMVGRVDAVTPSVVMFNCISNQEVVYKEGTSLARLGTNNTIVPAMNEILERTRYILPAVQIG